MYKYKSIVKSALFVFVFVGLATLFGGGKVAALSCPGGGPNDNVPSDYGYNAGEQADGFAGAVVSSYYGSGNGWGDSRNGTRLDQAKYYLQSYLEDAPFPYRYNLSGNPQSSRIFTVNSGNSPIGRTDARWFGTGSATGDKLYADAGDPGYTCAGWDAIGPGRISPAVLNGNTGTVNSHEEAGNRHALDCGESYYASGNPNPMGKKSTRFYISQIPHPNGESGHWEVRIAGAYFGNQTIGNIDANPMNSSTSYFTVNNGSTVRINLIWHADKPKEQHYPSSGTCLTLTVGNSGKYHNAGGDHPTRQHVTGGGMGVGKINGDTINPRQSGINGYAPGDGGGDGDKTWYYIPVNSNTIQVTKTQEWYKDSNPNKGWHVVDGSTYYLDANGNWTPTPTTITCYSIGPPSGQCQVLSITGDGPGGSVVTPGNVYFIVRVTNSSRDGLQFWSPTLVANGVTYGSNDVLNPGESHDFYGSFGAPPWSHTPSTFSFTSQYFAGVPLGSCSWSGPVYQYFQIQPRANITSMDKENPTTVTYTSGGQLLTGPSFPVTTYSALGKTGAGCPNASDNHATVDTYGNLDHTYVYSNPCINAGDTFCAYTTISPASGWHGPDGYPDIYAANASAQSACAKTVNEPYAHFQGSDVSAGGGFGQSCTPTPTGAISTYSKAAGAAGGGGTGNGGSGAQFGAQALDIISGLTSASLRTSSPTGLSGLTFANNDGHIGGSQPARTNGGYLGGAANFCVPDYFSDKPDSLSTPSIATGATAGAGAAEQYYKPNGGTLTLNGGTIPNTNNQAIFVEGDVTITGNIQYDAAARASIKDIPTFYLVVKGNIHIAPGVTRLDGVYIAQPTSTAAPIKTGFINSCWISNPNQIYNSCKNQLTVNGSFVAYKVLLTRSYSSLRYSQNGEHNLGGYAAHNCGNAGNDVPSAATASASDCAAEIFNFNPEVYMSQPGLKPTYGATSGKFDAITSLSPVL